MPRTRVTIPNVAEAGPALWSNCIRAGDLLFISGQVARALEGGKTLVGRNEYEQAKQIFTRIEAICEGAGGSLEDVVDAREEFRRAADDGVLVRLRDRQISEAKIGPVMP